MERLDTNEHLRGIVMNLPASPGISECFGHAVGDAELGAESLSALPPISARSG